MARKINYPLIISDFDGTLLRSDHTVKDETIQKIKEYVDAGGIFVLCSGREYRSALVQARKLGITGLLSSFNGGYVVNLQTGEVLIDLGLDVEESVEIATKVAETGEFFNVYYTNEYFGKEDGAVLRYYEQLVETKAGVLDKPVVEFIRSRGEQVKKIAIIVAPKDRDAVYDRLNAALGEKYYVTCSGPDFLDLSSKKHDKGTAVMQIARHYNIPLERVITIGDNLNDYPMLKIAGKGLCVANGDPSLKGKIEFFPYSNDENAVGRIIETYGFQGEDE